MLHARSDCRFKHGNRFFCVLYARYKVITPPPIPRVLLQTQKRRLHISTIDVLITDIHFLFGAGERTRTSTVSLTILSRARLPFRHTGNLKNKDGAA